jgi:hypothetical protein
MVAVSCSRKTANLSTTSNGQMTGTRVPDGSFSLNGPEKNIQGHQVQHLLNKLIIKQEVRVVNVDLDDRGKGFISLDFALGRSWTRPGENYPVKKIFDFHCLGT